jgi:manganese/iron transport system permease protein
VGVGADRGDLRLSVGYLMLKGWSLIGDALSHSIVPGVAGAYMLGLPFAAGAFLAGGLAAAAMLLIRARTRLREDAVIGMIFISFFALGLFMVSISPTPINVQTIVLGNVLAITPADTTQLVIIGAVTLVVLSVIWKDLMLVFFDESHARAIGVRATALKVIFFALLAASTVAAMQTVGAFLVIALVVTPRGHRLSAHRPVPAADRDRRRHGIDHLLCRRLSELLSSMAPRAAW